MFWRDLHAVMGFWVAGLALVLLVSGLPWASVWGDAFKAVRGAGSRDWTVGGTRAGGGEHVEHDHRTMTRDAAGVPSLAMLDTIVAKASAEALAFPVLVEPPGKPGAVWTVKSDAQNRPLRTTITFDATTGVETLRERFVDRPLTDRVVGYGIAWHEGQLFGWVNQLVGVLTAVALLTLMVSGFVLWRRRKPEGLLGAPPLPAVPARIGGVVLITFVFAALLPLLALSLIALVVFDRLLLPRMPRVARWLGAA